MSEWQRALRSPLDEQCKTSGLDISRRDIAGRRKICRRDAHEDLFSDSAVVVTNASGLYLTTG